MALQFELLHSDILATRLDIHQPRFIINSLSKLTTEGIGRRRSSAIEARFPSGFLPRCECGFPEYAAPAAPVRPKHGADLPESRPQSSSRPGPRWAAGATASSRRMPAINVLISHIVVGESKCIC